MPNTKMIVQNMKQWDYVLCTRLFRFEFWFILPDFVRKNNFKLKILETENREIQTWKVKRGRRRRKDLMSPKFQHTHVRRQVVCGKNHLWWWLTWRRRKTSYLSALVAKRTSTCTVHTIFLTKHQQQQWSSLSLLLLLFFPPLLVSELLWVLVCGLKSDWFICK